MRLQVELKTNNWKRIADEILLILTWCQCLDFVATMKPECRIIQAFEIEFLRRVENCSRFDGFSSEDIRKVLSILGMGR